MRFLKNFKQLSWRLTLIYSVIFIFVVICADLFVLFGLKYFLLTDIKKQEFKHIIDRIYIEIGNESVRDVVEDFNIFLKDYAIKITDENGHLIDASEEIKQVQLPVGEKEDRYRTFKYSGIKYLYYKKLIHHNEKVLILEIIKDVSLLDKIRDTMSIIMYLSLFFGSTVAILSGVFLTKQFLKPIAALTYIADKITIGNLKERLEVKDVDDELSKLAKTFNKMLARLEKAVSAQNQFVSDASHELRTPILVIKGYINLLDRWGSKDQQVLKEAITAIKDETESMTGLIEKLLLIARGEERQAIKRQPVKWDHLVQQVVEQSKVIAPHLEICISENPETTLVGDRDLLKQMLRIFMDNSIKFTAENGTIRLRTMDLGTEIEFIIEDSGIGIPKDELDKIFERFYKVDKARSKEQGGHGLGLYLAKQIIERHQGRMDIESELGKKTIVRVYLPKKTGND